MKIFSALALLALIVSATGQETAYQALRAVANVKGEAFLDSLLIAEGREGNMQPATWRLVFEDATSRAGFREIEVQGGEIISQRAPIKPSADAPAPVDLNRLQLDSDGAFTVAEGEATRDQIRFTSANYLLQADDATGLPSWKVELLDGSGSIVQTVRVSADSGAIIGSAESPVVSRDPDAEGEEPDRSRDIADSNSTESQIHNGAVEAGRTVKNAFKRVGGSIQEVFTGRRTIDKDVED